MRRHLIRLASVPVFLPIWQRLVALGFCVQRVGSTMQNLRKLGENSDPIVSRMWTKLHEIFRRSRKPFALFNALFGFSVSRFIQMFAIKSRSRRKMQQMQRFLAPFLWEGRLRLLYGSWLGRLTTHYLTKCG